MTHAARLFALGGVCFAIQAGAQQPVRIDGPSQAETVRMLRTAFSSPHDVLLADSTRRLVLPRAASLPRTTIVVGGSASVAGSVGGDLIVVGGDLYLRPGASIDGHAIAIGGGVYGSTLARVGTGIRAIRDRTFDVVQPPPHLVLRYRSLEGHGSSFEFPIVEGLRIPTYDRVEGLGIPWGPVLRPTARVDVEPTVTYRSHLGAWDPGLNVVDRAGEIWRLTLDARRSTFTNDAWIYSDLINSLDGIAIALDTRNYYRADRGELRLSRTDRTITAEIESMFGVVTERAWSVGDRDTLGSRPWTAFGRGDINKYQRANPAIERGRISSAVVGTTVRWQFGDVMTNGTAKIEVPFQAPSDERFVQLTLDGTIQFPTFRAQRFRSDIHAVVTPGDTAPPQRFAYLGGSGTLPVIEETLSLGGDQLLYIDSRYEIPLTRIVLPFIGSPVIAIRHRVGSAGVQRLPKFVQNVGVQASLSFLRVDFAIDPATRKHRTAVSLAFER
jgi:hypothetical protein